MSRQRPSSSGLPFNPPRISGAASEFDRFYWDEYVPVPPDLHLDCSDCGRDLTGVAQRTCPDCGRAFHIPIPEALNLHCPNCDYELTGLTSRRCPECGRGFAVRELLTAQRMAGRYSLRDRLPWHDRFERALAVVLVGFGALATMSTAPLLFFFCVLVGAGIAISSYSRGNELFRVALWVGVFWAIVGIFALLLL